MMDKGIHFEVMLQRMLNQQQQAQAREKKEPILDPLSIEGVVKRLKEFRASKFKKKVVVMTGAGISTAAGIPDFRSPGTGLYDNLQKYNLPTPQAVFEIGYFKHNPQPFYNLAKELYPAKFKPTLSHYFIRLLEEEGLLLRNFTQNIDTLERRAGISDDMIVEAHGAFNTAHCITCGKSYPSDKLKDKVFGGELPLCEKEGCAYIPPEELRGDEPYQGLVKPDIVFFGESLPDRFAHCVMEDLPKCELLIIMGTSLKVHPFASLIDRVSDDCPRLLINLEPAGQPDPIRMMFTGDGRGLNFDPATNYRDVFLQDTCDSGCRQLAKFLNLEDKLMTMFKEEHERLDSEISSMMAALSLSEANQQVFEPMEGEQSSADSVTIHGKADNEQTVVEPMDGHSTAIEQLDEPMEHPVLPTTAITSDNQCNEASEN